MSEEVENEPQALRVEDYDWNDINPIEQNDGPDPVVMIAYPEEYVYLMNLFRGVIAVQEYSARVLQLTEELIEINPASYTVWQYRRSCLRTIGSNLYDELDFLDDFASENPKNYQLWYHRRAIIEMLKDPSREFEFTEAVFAVDGKNYHAWAHRQWVIRTFDLYDNELVFIEKCLEKDVRNNSAWNQRWMIIHDNKKQPPSPEIIQGELAYTFQSIENVKKNESSWNYLRGLVNFHPEVGDQVINWLTAMVDGTEMENPFALALLADLRESQGTVEGYEIAKKLIRSLVDLDAIRAKKWIRRLNGIQTILDGNPAGK